MGEKRFVSVLILFSLLIDGCFSMDEHPPKVLRIGQKKPVQISSQKNCLCDDSKFLSQITTERRDRQALKLKVQKGSESIQRLQQSLRNLESSLRAERTARQRFQRSVNIDTSSFAKKQSVKALERQLQQERLERQNLASKVEDLTASLNREIEERRRVHAQSRSVAKKSFGTISGPTCAIGWLSYGGSCYYVQKVSIYVNYDDAALDCQHRGAQLVSVETIQEFRFLKNYLVGIYDSIKNKTVNGWVVGAKTVGYNDWRWESGELLTARTHVWAVGQPLAKGKCIAFYPLVNFDFSTIFCGRYHQQFICEKQN